MRRHFLLVSTTAAMLGVTAFGFADPPATKGGASIGLSAGGSTSSPAAKPAASGSIGVSASAPGAPASTATAGANAGPKSKSGASPAAGAIAKGHAAYMARDYAGAIQAYRDATHQDPTDVSAYYFLGEAQIAGGAMTEADGTFTAGMRYAGGKDDWRAKLLFVLADLRERQGKWADAKKVWEEYGQFVSTHPNVKGHPASATDRVKTVDAHVDLDSKYAPVRQRIEQRLKESGTIPNAADETKKK
ncbi:MAG: tetratricopeptide repeat protein [Polyangiaceae bacterium]